jgi:ABC-type branched-subunit amino acid transport system substrate-binding protein
MFKGRLRRTMTLFSVSALALGMVSTGLLTGSANAANSTPGVTAKSITIGATVPLSGVAASYASVSAASNAVFRWVNAHGGVNGRKIKYIRLDDCYDLAAYGLGCTAGASVTTLSQTQVLVAQDHVFATVGSLGTAAQDSVLSYMKTNGVPQLFVNSGSIDWNQPAKYPDLFGYQPSYVAEGKIFAKYIKANDAGQTIGFIGQNDDFGTDGLLGLQDGGVNLLPANTLTYNAADAISGSSSDLVADIATLQKNNVQVVVLDAVPGFTTGFLQIAKGFGYSPSWIISSVGADPSLVNNASEAAAITTDYFPQVTSNSDPWVPWVRKVLRADTADASYFPGLTATSPMNGNEFYGAGEAVAFVEALKAEGKNVTRAGIVKSMLSTTFDTPAITPLKYTKSNHQGMLGGTIAIIASNGTKVPTKALELSTNVFTTGNAKASPITVTSHFIIDPIPSWLK